MNKYLILPDIHGRKFWKEPVKHVNNYEKVIFLGDYLDPYTSREEISILDSIENFKEILEFKKNRIQIK